MTAQLDARGAGRRARRGGTRSRCAPRGHPRSSGHRDRVNLIGEHTDYNDGFVLPVAIDLEIHIAYMPTDDRRVELRRLDLDEQDGFDLDGPRSKTGTWLDYVVGHGVGPPGSGSGVDRSARRHRLDPPTECRSFVVGRDRARVRVGDARRRRTGRRPVPSRASSASEPRTGMSASRAASWTSSLSRVGVAGSALFLDCRSARLAADPRAGRRGDRRLSHGLTASPRRIGVQPAAKPVRGRGGGDADPRRERSRASAT